MEPGAQQAGVQGELGVGGKAGDDGRPLGVPLERLPKATDQGVVGLPLDILGWIERREAPYGSCSVIFERAPASALVARAAANSSAEP